MKKPLAKEQPEILNRLHGAVELGRAGSAGCFVDGDLVGPDWKPCPDVVIYMSIDTLAPADSAVVTDSVDYEPECVALNPSLVGGEPVHALLRA